MDSLDFDDLMCIDEDFSSNDIEGNDHGLLPTPSAKDLAGTFRSASNEDKNTESRTSRIRSFRGSISSFEAERIDNEQRLTKEKQIAQKDFWSRYQQRRPLVLDKYKRRHEHDNSSSTKFSRCVERAIDNKNYNLLMENEMDFPILSDEVDEEAVRLAAREPITMKSSSLGHEGAICCSVLRSDINRYSSSRSDVSRSTSTRSRRDEKYRPNGNEKERIDGSDERRSASGMRCSSRYPLNDRKRSDYCNNDMQRSRDRGDLNERRGSSKTRRVRVDRSPRNYVRNQHSSCDYSSSVVSRSTSEKQVSASSAHGNYLWETPSCQYPLRCSNPIQSDHAGGAGNRSPVPIDSSLPECVSPHPNRSSRPMSEKQTSTLGERPEVCSWAVPAKQKPYGSSRARSDMNGSLSLVDKPYASSQLSRSNHPLSEKRASTVGGRPEVYSWEVPAKRERVESISYVISRAKSNRFRSPVVNPSKWPGTYSWEVASKNKRTDSDSYVSNRVEGDRALIENPSMEYTSSKSARYNRPISEKRSSILSRRSEVYSWEVPIKQARTESSYVSSRIRDARARSPVRDSSKWSGTHSWAVSAKQKFGSCSDDSSQDKPSRRRFPTTDDQQNLITTACAAKCDVRADHEIREETASCPTSHETQCALICATSSIERLKRVNEKSYLSFRYQKSSEAPGALSLTSKEHSEDGNKAVRWQMTTNCLTTEDSGYQSRNSSTDKGALESKQIRLRMPVLSAKDV